jgi:hypothetical protein
MRPGLYPVLFGGIDAAAREWAIAVTAAGGTVSSAQMRRVSMLIRSLKSAGVWSSLDRLWLFASENTTQALIDLKARATATAVNSPTFTASRGYLGNGSNAYIDSGFNASTAGGNYVRDDASFGVWVETGHTNTGQAQGYIGNDETNFSHILQDDTAAVGSVNANSADASFTFSTRLGLWHAQRTASNAQALFQNGASVAASSNASVALVNRNVFILASNNGGVAYRPVAARIASAHIGKSLTAGQNAAIYSAERAYMTAVGVG